MASVIYIKSSGDEDPTGDQLELLHRYSDQAHVWAYLLLKDADLLMEAASREEIEEEREKTRKQVEEYHIRRDKWKGLQERLKALNEGYESAVIKVLQQQGKGKDEIKATPIPPAKDFFPKETPPEKLAEATGLAEKIKNEYAWFHPSALEIGYHGPKLTDKDKEYLFQAPDIEGMSTEEIEKLKKEYKTKTGIDLDEWKQTGASPGMDLAIGTAYGLARDKSQGGPQEGGIIDPSSGAKAFDTDSSGRASYNDEVIQDFAGECLARAVASYNPHHAEDTGEGFEGKQATFYTYLYQVMKNEIKSRKNAFMSGLGLKNVLPPNATPGEILSLIVKRLKVSPEDLKEKVAEAGLTEESPIEEWRNFYNQFLSKTPKINKIPVSLDQPLGGEESLTVAETVAEKADKEGLDFAQYVEPLKEWLAAERFPRESAERMVDIFQKIFLEHKTESETAREVKNLGAGGGVGLETGRSRPKEIAFLKRHKVDISSLPATTVGVSQEADRQARAKLITNFFAQLAEKAKTDPKAAEDLKKAKADYNALPGQPGGVSSPNAARVKNIIYGRPEGQSAGRDIFIMKFLKTQPEIAELIKEIERSKKKASLEEFLTCISTLRKEGGLNYNLLRNKIEQKLSEVNPQLFVVYTYLYEDTFSNPDTARLMQLSPPRITGLKKKIVSTLLDLPEIQNFFQENESGSISPLRRFIYNEGDVVKVTSVNETGTITSSLNEWYNVHLDNGNDVLTIKEDIQKYCTLVDSANNVLSHYYNRSVLSPQCYLSFVGGSNPQLVILELRPTDELKTTARLHINNSLVDITEITEKLPDNLLSILKGHIGVSASLDTPFTALFEEVE